MRHFSSIFVNNSIFTLDFLQRNYFLNIVQDTNVVFTVFTYRVYIIGDDFNNLYVMVKYC